MRKIRHICISADASMDGIVACLSFPVFFSKVLLGVCKQGFSLVVLLPGQNESRIH
jgi:hypothetical protein